MNPLATAVMIIAMIVLWGGLIYSVLHLMKHPDIPLEQIPDDP